MFTVAATRTECKPKTRPRSQQQMYVPTTALPACARRCVAKADACVSAQQAPSPRRRSRSPSPLPRSRSPRRRSGSGEREPAWRARLEGILAGTVGAIVLEPSSVYEELAALSAADASAVLDRFAESNLAGVKNPGSFLQGIVRRVAAEGSADLTTCLGSLPRPLRNSFARLMEEGRLRKGDVESRVATQLRVRYCGVSFWLNVDLRTTVLTLASPGHAS